MFQIIVVPKDSASNSSLFFRTPEKAEIAFNNIHELVKGSKPVDVLRQTDEFGITLTMDKINIVCALLVDMIKQQELQAVLRGSSVPTDQPKIIT